MFKLWCELGIRQRLFLVHETSCENYFLMHNYMIYSYFQRQFNSVS